MVQNPQLAYAFFQAMLMLNLVAPTVLQVDKFFRSSPFLDNLRLTTVIRFYLISESWHHKRNPKFHLNHPYLKFRKYHRCLNRRLCRLMLAWQWCKIWLDLKLWIRSYSSSSNKRPWWQEWEWECQIRLQWVRHLQFPYSLFMFHRWYLIMEFVSYFDAWITNYQMCSKNSKRIFCCKLLIWRRNKSKCYRPIKGHKSCNWYVSSPSCYEVFRSRWSNPSFFSVLRGDHFLIHRKRKHKCLWVEVHRHFCYMYQSSLFVCCIQ